LPKGAKAIGKGAREAVLKTANQKNQIDLLEITATQ